jgi:WD40 repeat protein
VKLQILAIGLLSLTATASAQDAKPRLDALGDPLPAQALHRFGTARFCTQAEVASLVISADAKLMAAADRAGRVYLWEADTGKARIVSDAGAGKRVAISPDGQWLALGEDGPFEIRNLKKTEPPRLQIGTSPRAFAFTPDSKGIVLFTTDDAELLHYDIDKGKIIRRLGGLSDGIDITTIAVSGDGKFVAAAGKPMVEMEKPFVRIIIWDAVKGKNLKEIDHAGVNIRNLVFRGDHTTLIGQIGSRLVAWNASTGEVVKGIKHTVGAAYALDSTGKTLATTLGPKVVDFDNDKELHDFDAPALIRNLAMSGDGTLLAASALRFDSASPRLMLWDLKVGKERTVPDVHRHYVDAVAFSHDDKMIATASHVEGVARIWDAKSAKLLHTLKLDSLAARKSGGPYNRRTLADGLAFSADRNELFVGGQRWDLDKAAPIPLKADEDFVFTQTNSQRAVMSSDGRHAASFLSSRAILFWDPAKAKTIQRIEPDLAKEDGNWHALAFTPDGKQAAAGLWFPPFLPGGDVAPPVWSIHVWDVAAGKRVKKLRQRSMPVVRLMFSPDGETLAVVGFPARLELWHLPTGRLLREMVLVEMSEVPKTYVPPTVAFAPHGQWLAVTHKPGEITLIETITGKTISTLHGHLGHVNSLAFSPDSRRLLSGGRDTTALLWSVYPEAPKLPKAWKDADQLWEQLGGNPDQAYAIVWALIANPDHAIEVFTKRLVPDDGVTEKEIRELITNLASPKFAKRDTAITRLKQIGTRSLPALEQELKKAPDLETTRRIQELLATVQTSLTPETARDLRALQVLELIGTAPARKLLTQIAGGDAQAAKTRLAHAALSRLR